MINGLFFSFFLLGDLEIGVFVLEMGMEWNGLGS